MTNGVHAPTWVAPEILDLAEDAGGPAGADGALPEDGPAWEHISAAGPDRIWQIRRQLRSRLVVEARRRLRASWHQRGASDAELTWIDEALDENVLTIGFARRVPSYKRLTLMLSDPDKLTELLLDPERPVQIIIAGKAHPADDGGKLLIQQMVRFTDDPRVRHRIVFLPDYDMALGHALVQGCDVWLNNPLRPLEACGTSGMKSALNGGLNLSVRDGWWDEWYDGANGWAIPSADGVTETARRDEVEAAALYDLIGQSVAPLFYDSAAGGPTAPLAGDGRAHAAHPRAQGPGHPDGPRVHHHAVRPGGPVVPGTGQRRGRCRVRRRQGPGHLGGQDRRGVAVDRDRARGGGGGRPAARRPAGRQRRGVARRADPQRRHRAGRLRPGGGAGRAHSSRSTPPWTWKAHPAASRAPGTPARWNWAAPGRSATPSACCPAHPLLANPAELGLVAFPDAPAGMTNGDLR